MTVDGDVGDIGQELGCPILAAHRLKQFRRLVDEAGRIAAVEEMLMADDAFQKGQIGGDAANAELAQGPVHAPDRLVRRRRPGGDLLQQRVVETGDHRAGIGGAAVEPDAEAGGAAIGGDAAVIGNEILLRVLRGDAALQGVAVEADLRLRRHAGLWRADGRTLDNTDLRLDDVDAGHLLGDGVLHLDARVDLDEVEGAGIGVLQELHGAGADIVGGIGDGQGMGSELAATSRVKIRRRRPFNDLLMAALDGAVALIKMRPVAVAVAENLYLDVTGAFHQLFQIDLVAAKGGARLASGLFHRAGEGGLVGNDAHAAAAAAPRRLEHQRIADCGGQLVPCRRIIGQRIGGRHNRHASRNRQLAGGDLVAEPPHGLRRGADEGDAGGSAGLGELRAFRQKAVAGMDSVGTGVGGDAQHFVDRQIGLNRPHRRGEMGAPADPVGLVGLEAVQRQLVLFGEDGDGADAQLVGGAQHPDGDFGSVGDEQLADILHRRNHGSRLRRASGLCKPRCPVAQTVAVERKADAKRGRMRCGPAGLSGRDRRRRTDAGRQ